MFITFEGIDGCGKSTQMKMFIKWLQDEGYNVIVTREPGGTDFAEKIRNLLLNYKDSEIDSVTEFFLFSAARSHHVKNKIRPALEFNMIVVCDRFIHSSIAYQIYAGTMVRSGEMTADDAISAIRLSYIRVPPFVNNVGFVNVVSFIVFIINDMPFTVNTFFKKTSGRPFTIRFIMV
jgi:thymidylate kinase